MNDSRKIKLSLAIVLVVVSTVLLFCRLSHYSLWDDEAMTALGAKGVLRSGDTTAVLDHNLVAYRSGSLLSDLHDRSTPPLPAYVTAMSFALFGENTFAARLPFALCGVLWAMLMVHWFRKENIGVRDWILFLLAIIGNVSLFLFFRQCRYYSIAILCSTAIVYLYLNWSGRRREYWGMIVLSVMLYGANYMNYFALYSCLLVDYIVWGRKRRVLSAKEWSILLLPQVLVIGILLSIWNPLKTGNSAGLLSTAKSLKVWLMCVSFCDMNACEFGVGIFLLLGPIVALLFRDAWLLRASFGFVVYVVMLCIVSPQVMTEMTDHSDVRYLAPLIPLCIFIGVRSIIVITRKVPALAIPLAVIAFGTTLFDGITLRPFYFESTFVQYLRELSHPPQDPYTPTAEWIRKNIPARASVWVAPGEMTYPLMFHAQDPVYCWQISSPAPEKFKDLDPIHFVGRLPPDYVITFGSQSTKQLNLLSPPETYEHIAMIDVYYKDSFRPELYWHRFQSRPNFDRKADAVYVLKRTKANAGAGQASLK